ncbi:MAG TPA: hypothetical protein VM680_12220 [Verrucomicrobiae bacterium]|nr:hypothetical protein [Verrucomicrobiae bacterium]
MKDSLNRRTWLGRTAASLFTLAIAFAIGAPNSQAKPRPSSLNIVPTINNISVQNGQLVATGTATATVKGQTTTVPFTAPVNIALAEDQSAATDCPVLDLTLAPINLDILGLVVETSPICLQIVAHPGEGLLGDLLCSVAHLLDGGLSLGQILAGLGLNDPVTGAAILPGIDVNALLGNVTDLLNTTIGQLLGAVLADILEVDAQHVCSVLHLELGPVDLNLLGLEVILDDCDGGPVVVDVTAETGKGNLLGNLLCGLLDGGGINLGTTLGDLLNGLLGAIRQ